MGSGRKPDPRRRAEIARLRSRGLTLAEIGRRLGVTRQAVFDVLARRLHPPAEPAVPCAGCGAPITSAGAIPSDAGRALCLPCLASRPEAPLGVRLKAFRLAAGLTKVDLARRLGLTPAAVHQYEMGRREPRWQNLVPLIRVLGPGLLTLGLGRAT
jgi:transcriptional regulator with XRE-family HTH domain